MLKKLLEPVKAGRLTLKNRIMRIARFIQVKETLSECS